MAARSRLRIPVEIPAAEKRKFRSRSERVKPFYDRAVALEATGLEIEVEELFTYALHNEWRDEVGWRSFHDFWLKVPERRARFDDYVDASSGNLVLHHPYKEMVESIGVGASLAFGTRVLDVTSADFRRIPETSARKTLDFERTLLAAGVDGVFEIECKGTHDGSSYARQERSVRAKKEAERAMLSRRTPRVLLGTIFDIQHEGDGPTRLVVLDPPEEEELEDPEYLRLLHRLQHYLEELRFVTRGQFVVALGNRVAALKRLGKRWRELDRIPLVDWKGATLPKEPIFGHGVELHGFGMARGRAFDLRLTEDVLRARSRSRVLKEDQRLQFRGLLTSVMEALVLQDFDSILALRSGTEYAQFDTDAQGSRPLVLASGIVSGRVRLPDWDSRNLGPVLDGLKWPQESGE